MKYNDKEIGIPTLEQIKEYIMRNNIKINAIDVYEKYSKKGWLNNKGLPIKTLESMVNSFNGVVLTRKKKNPKKYIEPQEDKFVTWARANKNELLSKSTIYEKDLLHRLKQTFHKRVKAQLPFLINGKLYYADIAIPSLKLIIEVDGGYHNTETQRIKDAKRDEDFKSIGYTTLRYTNEQVQSKEGKKQIIQEILSYK